MTLLSLNPGLNSRRSKVVSCVTLRSFPYDGEPELQCWSRINSHLQLSEMRAGALGAELIAARGSRFQRTCVHAFAGCPPAKINTLVDI